MEGSGSEDLWDLAKPFFFLLFYGQLLRVSVSFHLDSRTTSPRLFPPPRPIPSAYLTDLPTGEEQKKETNEDTVECMDR